MKTELEILREKVAEIEKRQAECNHDWDKPYQDTIQQEIYENKWVGVDCFPAPTGRYETIYGWSRICKKCQKKEFTDKTELVPIKTEERPKFGR